MAVVGSEFACGKSEMEKLYTEGNSLNTSAILVVWLDHIREFLAISSVQRGAPFWKAASSNLAYCDGQRFHAPLPRHMLFASMSFPPNKRQKSAQWHAEDVSQPAQYVKCNQVVTRVRISLSENHSVNFGVDDVAFPPYSRNALKTLMIGD